MSRGRLVVFAKQPLAGAVKTRLTPPFSASVTKYNTVTSSVISQGRLPERSFRSSAIVDFFSAIGRMRSRVVRKVMMKNTIPMLAKKIIAL